MSKANRLLVALFLIWSCLADPSWARQAGGHPVLLISVDGLRPDDVFSASQRGVQLPNLRQMIAEGASARSVRNVTPTITMPNHTTLITGVPPSEHGIYDNLVFDPLRRRTDRYFWYAQDIKVPTLWDSKGQRGQCGQPVLARHSGGGFDRHERTALLARHGPRGYKANCRPIDAATNQRIGAGHRSKAAAVDVAHTRGGPGNW